MKQDDWKPVSTGDYLADMQITFEQAVDFWTIVCHEDQEKGREAAIKRIEEYRREHEDV